MNVSCFSRGQTQFFQGMCEWRWTKGWTSFKRWTRSHGSEFVKEPGAADVLHTQICSCVLHCSVRTTCPASVTIATGCGANMAARGGPQLPGLFSHDQRDTLHVLWMFWWTGCSFSPPSLLCENVKWLPSHLEPAGSFRRPQVPCSPADVHWNGQTFSRKSSEVNGNHTLDHHFGSCWWSCLAPSHAGSQWKDVLEDGGAVKVSWWLRPDAADVVERFTNICSRSAVRWTNVMNFKGENRGNAT